MKILIPLAGLGTRLRPHTLNKPKPLVAVAGKPMLGHILDELADLPTEEIEEIIFVVGHLGDQIESYVRQAYPQYKTRYLTQKELNGQSQAILLAKEYVPGELLIIFADTLFKADLASLKHTDADVILHLWEVADPSRFGVALLDEQGFITAIVEKPKLPVSRLAVVGVYYFKEAATLFGAIEQQIAQQRRLGGEFYLADAMTIMLEGGARFRAHHLEAWEDCGTIEALLQANRYLLNRDGPAYLNSAEAIFKTEQDAPGLPDSVILPPVYIGTGATIERSVVGPYVSLGAGASLCDSVIQDSLIGERTQVRAARLINSVIGSQARVRGVSGRLNLGDFSEIDLT